LRQFEQPDGKRFVPLDMEAIQSEYPKGVTLHRARMSRILRQQVDTVTRNSPVLLTFGNGPMFWFADEHL
jgi:hypothetical protein